MRKQTNGFPGRSVIPMVLGMLLKNKPMTSIYKALLYSFLLITVGHAQSAFNWKKVTVLVYSKNGKGYVHDNIPSAVNCIQLMGKQYGFKVDTSSDASVMTETNLKKYTLLIFPSTNNDVF